MVIWHKTRNVARQSPKTARNIWPEELVACGFTLIEMIVVIAIVGVLMVLIVPVTWQVFSATRLNKSGNTVWDILTDAQTLAVTRGIDVEVRFYESIDKSNGDTDPLLRGIQLYAPQSPDALADVDDTIAAQAGTAGSIYVPAGAMQWLESSICVSEETTLSSIVSLKNQTDNSQPTGPANYWSFHFLSDGSTDLLVGSPWFLTVLEKRYLNTGVPPNFFTIQIDPATGRLRQFRPGT